MKQIKQTISDYMNSKIYRADVLEAIQLMTIADVQTLHLYATALYNDCCHYMQRGIIGSLITWLNVNMYDHLNYYAD